MRIFITNHPTYLTHPTSPTSPAHPTSLTHPTSPTFLARGCAFRYTSSNCAAFTWVYR